MICNSCKKEFDNINELKYCPYCGEKTEEKIEEKVQDKVKIDTLRMPAITEEDIKKYNRSKFLKSLKNIFIQKKVIVPIVTLFVIGMIGVFGYKLLIAKPADQIKINEDLIGKTITLPKGTKIVIKKTYIKSFSINSRKTDKTKDDVKVLVTLNNGVIEVKTVLSMLYMNKGENKWEFDGKVLIVGDAKVMPVLAMDEKQFLDDLRKLTISISEQEILLSGKQVKTLNIKSKTPSLDKGKEEVLVNVLFDSGLLAATGIIKCNLNFENEKWGIGTIERNSNEDFIAALSPSFSQDRIIQIIRKEGLDESVSYKELFAGKGFSVKDTFTKSINISSKTFDAASKTLTATTSRENVAGVMKSTLLRDYTFSLSFSDLALLKKSKTTVSTATVAEIANETVIATIANVSIEGGNVLFWFPDNHKITEEEAKTFNIVEVLSKKGLNNIKYVYGTISYIDGKKTKSVSVVAIYSLVNDNLKGYNFKLEKIVGEDSPNFKSYSKEAISK